MKLFFGWFVVFMLFITKLYAIDYTNEVFFRAGYSSLGGEALVDGYINNNIRSDTNISFDVNVILNDKSYIYNIDKNYTLPPIKGEIYASYEEDRYTISLGMKESVASNDFYNKLFDRIEYSFGTKLLSNIDNGASSQYTVTEGSLDNNSAFSLSVLADPIDDKLYIGVTLTPNLSYRLSSNKQAYYDNNESALDVSLMYYDEYEAIGYGLNISGRQYIGINEDIMGGNDISIGGVLDYFGLYFRANYVIGNNNFLDNKEEIQQYSAIESSLYYRISLLTVGLYYLQSSVISNYYDYNTQLFEIDVSYQFADNFALHSGVFREKLQDNSDIGVLMAISVTL